MQKDEGADDIIEPKSDLEVGLMGQHDRQGRRLLCDQKSSLRTVDEVDKLDNVGVAVELQVLEDESAIVNVCFFT